MSHWKEGDTEPPLRVRVTDSLGPPDLLGHEAEVIVAKGAGHPPILRRVGIVEEGGAIQPGESAGEIVIPWLPSETVPGVYEVMVRVDGQRSAPARGYGVIVIERALG